MNIGGKLILSFLLVTLVPTVFIAFLTTSLISHSKKADSQETINNNLRAAWMQYYARAHQMQYGMLQASTERYIQDAIEQGDSGFLRFQIKRWKEMRPYVDLWAVVDVKARVIASKNTPEKGMRLSFDGFVEKAMQKKTSFISTEIVPRNILLREGLLDDAVIEVEEERDRAPGKIEKGMMLMVITPVMNDGGDVIGAIVTGDLINNDTFVSDSLAGSIPGSLVTITMGDVQIATNVVNEAGVRTVGHYIPKAVIDELDANRIYRGEAAIDRKIYITAFDPIINHDGQIIGSLFVGVPKDRFVNLQYQNIKAVTGIAIAGLIMAAVVGYIITYRITKPIKAITRKAQLVASGNLDVLTGARKEGNDEIADLGRAFDRMVRNLRDNEQSISVSQDKLRQQKNLVESIVNSLPYCIYVLERNQGIAAWNRHAEQPCPICECNPDEDCYNLNMIAHLKNPSLKKGLYNVINSVFETGEPRSIEQKITHPDGKDLIVRISIFPILADKGRTADYVVWMAEDITKNKEIEASILSSEKLAAVGQLAAGIAHEVNNPLGGILNCFYNFRNKRLSDERKAEYLGFMEDGIKRVQNIVRQLLDFSQQHPPELRLTDINKMIEGVIPLFIHSVKGRDIRLVRNLGEGLPPILVDKHQIEQILVNLILNAIQAVEDEGVIEVSTRFENEWFCILVSDNGCGIPPENIPRIFDPFFTTKGVGKGTGLGLSVSRGIIEQHKGRIDVESQVGRGAVFKIRLPIHAEEV
jgi:signal transduction histidine kinase/HAMP domain-containing protein